MKYIGKVIDNNTKKKETTISGMMCQSLEDYGDYMHEILFEEYNTVDYHSKIYVMDHQKKRYYFS